MRRLSATLGSVSLLVGLALIASRAPTATAPDALAIPSPKDVAAPSPVTPLTVAPAPSNAVAASPVAHVAPASDLYFGDRLIVQVDARVAATVAQRHGLGVMSRTNSLGLARFSIPEGRDLDEVIQTLANDPEVGRAFPAGRTSGAGEACPRTVEPRDHQWHFSLGGAWHGADHVDRVTVAVLDSGVAYEDYADAQGTYVRAPSLADTRVVHPADFINQDDHANDDHSHGTHIASIILSDGAVRGVAPGATLMPVKVLDENNQGDELALIEGIYHAVDHGAHIINMSLSFGPGFVPSAELVRAINYAELSGVVMVGASGNAGQEQVSWPAASPSVISVGAITPRNDRFGSQLASYTNLGAIDVVAPGGEPGVDRNQDGFEDGILAETFAPGDPTDLGYWFQAGTSQAAAFVSGTVAQLLSAGAAADEVRGALQWVAWPAPLGVDAFEEGTGAGIVQLDWSVWIARRGWAPTVGRRFVSVMPYLEEDHGEVVPWVRFAVVDSQGNPVPNARVHALASGTTTARRSCKTGSDGTCGTMAPAYAGSIDDALAWSWEVETVEQNRVSAPLGTVMFADLPLEILIASMDAEEELQDAMFAVHWPAGYQEGLGSLVESYTVTNHGTGLLTSPLGLVFTPAALGRHRHTDHRVTLDGSGLLTSPLGVVTVRKLSIDLGTTALRDARLGEVSLVAADGSGLLTSPLGFHPAGLFRSRLSDAQWDVAQGTGLLTSPLGFRSSAIPLSTWRPMSSNLAGTAIGNRLESGGWTTETGVPAVSSLLGAGILGD